MRIIIAKRIPVRIIFPEEYGPDGWFQNCAR
jgi:hypothetical protein